jgi:hypothetical protein
LIPLLAFAFGFLGVELSLRHKGLYPPPPYPPTCDRPEFYQFHEPYGYRLHPSTERTYTYPKADPKRPEVVPRDLRVVANRHGFRSLRELDEEDERERILVLGDSFGFGDGVQHEERFSNLLEELHPQWRVDNLGMTGFGPDLMLMALEEAGLLAKPDRVLVCIYTDDFRRVRPYFAGVGYEIPRYTIVGGELTRIAYPKPHLLSGLHAWQMARRALWKLTRAEWQLVEAILERFLELGREHGFETVVVFLPGWEDTPFDRERRFFLRDWCTATATPFLDLTGPIHASEGKAFIPGNWHYGPAGNRIVAEALHAFLLGEE